MSDNLWGQCEKCRAVAPTSVRLCPDCLLASATDAFGVVGRAQALDPFEDDTEPSEDVLRQAIAEEEEKFRSLCEQETGSMDLYTNLPTNDLEEE